MRRLQSDGVLKARDVVVLPGLVVGRVGDPCWAGDDCEQEPGSAL